MRSGYGGAVSAPESEHFRGHVIVAGLHSTALSIVEQLVRINHPVVVIGDGADDRSILLVRQWGVRHLIGNARRRETLEAAGLSQAAAIICVEHDDVRSLEVALLSKELRPDIRVIVRCSNSAVGSAIETVTGPGTVLDSAGLAAPAFVEAALLRRSHQFSIGEDDFAIREVSATESGTLRGIYGDLAPIAVTPIEGPTKLCPGRDMQVEPGDQVALLGTIEQLARRGLQPDPAGQPQQHRTRFSPLRAVLSYAGTMRAFLQSITVGADRALRVTFLSVVFLLILATVVIYFGYVHPQNGEMDLLDAVYTTVQTVVTVGYGDYPFGNQPPYLELFDILLMLGGTALIAIVFAQLTDLLVSRRLAATFGTQRAATLKDHVIVVGLGSVGMRVVDELVAEGHRVSVIDSGASAAYLSRAQSLGVPVVAADATDPEALRTANIAEASAVAILTSDDLTNIETGLAVRVELGDRRASVPIVLRLFSRQLSATVEHSFGFRNVRSTAALASPWFVAAALGLDVFASFTLAHHTLLVGRLTVSPNGGLAGASVVDLDAHIRVIEVNTDSDANPEFPHREDSIFTPGAEFYIVGPAQEILKVLVHNHRWHPSHREH